MFRNFTKLSWTAMLLCGMLPVYAQTDITANGGIVSAQYSNTGTVGENYPNVIDNNVNTKYYIPQSTLWIGYQSSYTALVTQYSITSANDASDRDPKSWTLTGSNDGTTWTTLNTQTNQTFATRFQTNTYTFSNSNGYLYFRLNITANNGAGATQLAEWHLSGSASGPAAPGIPVITLSGFKANLNWSDNSTNETGFIVQSTIDGVTFNTLATVSANVHVYTDSSLSASTMYIYRVKAVNAAGISATVTASVSTPAAPSLTDLTDFTNGVVTDQYNTTGGEGIAKVTDNSVYSKYLTTHNATWIRFQLAGGGIATQYAITSGNDAVDRDPKNWAFQGSNDGTNWTTLQTQTGQVFTNRQKKRIFPFSNSTTYTYYRLNITANSGGSYTQLSELEIYGTGNGTINTAAPAAPSGFSASGVSGNQIVLDWTDNASNETSYTLQHSVDNSNWSTSFVAPNTTHFYSQNLASLTKYYYRLRAENASGSSAWVSASDTTLTSVPPAVWNEHWFQHVEPLSLFYSNSSVNIYYDAAVSTSITWMNQDFTDVWNYVKQNYGSFSDAKVNMIFHSKAGYSGGHPATVFDASHDYRNVGDLGGEWSTRAGWNLGASIHEIGHIVEGGSKGVKNSPAFPIWGDSKWAEIFIYDVTKRLGWTADAQQTYNDVINGTDDFPRVGTHWFKNWFYPIYTRSDSSAALNRYFVLLSQYFPQHNGEYSRDMNLGEFVHFWSGAAKYNLKEQADTAFGWNDQLDLQFKQAQIDFPFTYPDFPVASPVAVIPAKQPVSSLVWPNPASGALYLTLPADKQYTVDVYSVGGVKTLSQRIKGNSSTINVAALQSGLYIVTVTDGKRVISKEKVLISNK